MEKIQYLQLLTALDIFLKGFRYHGFLGPVPAEPSIARFEVMVTSFAGGIHFPARLIPENYSRIDRRKE